MYEESFNVVLNQVSKSFTAISVPKPVGVKVFMRILYFLAGKVTLNEPSAAVFTIFLNLVVRPATVSVNSNCAEPMISLAPARNTPEMVYCVVSAKLIPETSVLEIVTSS